MAELATPEWFEMIEARAAAATVDPSIDLGIEQRIVGTSPVTWHVVVTGGTVSVAPGPLPGAALRLTSDRPTAEAIHAGRLSAQRAFLDGELQVGGDISALIANRAVLELVGALLGDTTRADPPEDDLT